MSQPVSLRVRYTCAAVTLAAVLAAGAAGAQGGGGGQGQGTAAAAVPLSGRTSQAGSVVATETPVPGATTGINTLSTTVQVQGAIAGSRSARRQPLSGPLTLKDAVQRALQYNLGAVDLGQAVRQSRGQRTVSRAALLPSLVADVTGTREQVNLAALGVQFSSPIPGFTFPTVVGPFNQFDFRARVSQSIVDLTAWNNYRSASEAVRATELSLQDVRDVIVLAVGGSYLQTAAARARVDSGRAQLQTAAALYDQNAQRRAVGVVAQVDVDRSQVQRLAQELRVISLQNDFAKQKINLARMIGLPPTDQYDLAEAVPFSPAPALTLDDALRQASERRADMKAADAQVRAAERAARAARLERLPSLAVNADYGAIGNTPSDARRTFSVVGTLRVPVWQGGRTAGHIEQAEAALEQRRAELDDLGAQVESDVRKAYLDVDAAARQVDVAGRNVAIAQETLNLARQRFDAGVSDNVEVIQAQEALASADMDLINSVFAHNVAKLNLARSMGEAEERIAEFVKLP
jgi:outer membrane protein TolC